MCVLEIEIFDALECTRVLGVIFSVLMRGKEIYIDRMRSFV